MVSLDRTSRSDKDAHSLVQIRALNRHLNFRSLEHSVNATASDITGTSASDTPTITSVADIDPKSPATHGLPAMGHESDGLSRGQPDHDGIAAVGDKRVVEQDLRERFVRECPDRDPPAYFAVAKGEVVTHSRSSRFISVMAHRSSDADGSAASASA